MSAGFFLSSGVSVRGVFVLGDFVRRGFCHGPMVATPNIVYITTNNSLTRSPRSDHVERGVDRQFVRTLCPVVAAFSTQQCGILSVAKVVSVFLSL